MTSQESVALVGRRLFTEKRPGHKATNNLTQIVNTLKKEYATVGKTSNIIFAIRHGKAGNNEKQLKWGHQVCDEYLAQGNNLVDPDLEPMGEEQAKKTGTWLYKLLVLELQIDPENILFYTSSLKRCISTAIIIAKEIRKETRGKPDVFPRDELREWLGYEHQSNTDKRNTKTQIERHHRNEPVKLNFHQGFTEEDQRFVRDSDGYIKELWVDVGKRWVQGVASAQKTAGDNKKWIVVVSNNRAMQCGYRELGLPVDKATMAAKPDLNEKLIVEDMENAGVMALVVGEGVQPLTEQQQKDRQRKWETLGQADENAIKSLRKKERAKALADVKKWRDGDIAKFRVFVGEELQSEGQEKLARDLGVTKPQLLTM